MTGKTVLVTGASGGIGKATALGLAAMGAHLAITGRHRERTQSTAQEIQRAGGEHVDVFVADLSSQAEVRRLAAEVLRSLPPTAEGRVVMTTATLDLVLGGNAKKGDVLGAGRIAGIMAAKKTHQLIPLCHPLPITKVEVEIAPDHKLPGLIVTATVKVTGQTGVEMEALTAVSVACLTIYDMVKAVERGIVIDGIRLLEKSGGKSGHFRAKE
jgi:cyclic pyranopterin phosphate synthase